VGSIHLGGELCQLVNVYLEDNDLNFIRGIVVNGTIVDTLHSTKIGVNYDL